MLKNSKQLTEAINAHADSLEAIAKLCEDEKREPTADEQAEEARLLGSGDDPGVIAGLKAQRESAIKRENFQKEIAAQRAGAHLVDIPEQPGDGKPKKITVPARAKRHGSLVAFKGESAEKDAYIAGRIYAAELFGHEGSRKWLEDHSIKAALSTNDGQGSHIFIPVEAETAIIRLVEEYGVFRGSAMRSAMASNTKTVPVRVAGMTAYPVGETTTANEGSNSGTKSEPEYTNVELVARKWKTWLKMSDEVNEDTIISLAEQVTVESAQAFAYAEDNAGFNGDGTSTYHGITGVLNKVSAGSIHTALAGNTAFSTLDTADFLAMKGKLPRYPGIMPSWYISQEGYSDSMERIQMAAGGITPADIANGGTPRFLGSPVVITNVLNTTTAAQTSTNILAYGDLRMGALFGDRRGVSMSVTDQRYWEEDQIAIKATERFDINIHSTGTASAAGAILVMATPGA